MPPSPSPERRNLRRPALAALAAAALAWIAFRAMPFNSTAVTAVPTVKLGAGSLEARPDPSTPAPPMAARAVEAWRESVARPGIDASNIYKNAFVLFDQLTPEEKKLIREPREEVEAEKAAALFEKIRPILELLRDAMKAEYCDWGLAPYTFDTPMPHIGKAVDLGKLALWAAAYEFPSDPAAAIGDLGTRAQLGHHLADTLIGLLVESNFEKGAHDLLRQNLASFDAATAAQAMQFVSGSSIDADVKTAYESEAAGMALTIKQLAAKTPQERAQMFSAIDPKSQDPGAAAATREVLALYDDPARLAVEVAFLQQTELAMAEAIKLPEAQFQSWWKGIESELAGGHPLAKLALPSIAAVQTRIQQMRVERTLLGAGFDILQNGPAQLARYRDPATGNALLYVPTPSGFDLRSTYQVKGKPVTFSFNK